MADTPTDPRLTERRNPRTAAIDRASAQEIVDLIAAEDADGLKISCGAVRTYGISVAIHGWIIRDGVAVLHAGP